MSRLFISSQPCQWVNPRPVQDASQRYHTHGPIIPMQEPGPLDRLISKIGRVWK